MTKNTVQVTVGLPDNLAREAEANGLLTSQALETMLREGLRRRRVVHLFKAADRLAGLAMPRLTGAEVEEEIRAVRDARRAPNASGG